MYKRKDEAKKALQVLVTASDRLKAIGFKGLMPVRRSPRPSAEETSLKRKPRSARKNKNHLKFPLYTDEQIGFKKDSPLVSDTNLIANDADEDYETDEEILARTILVCKKDVLAALKRIKVAPNIFHLTLGNYQYQREFRKL